MKKLPLLCLIMLLFGAVPVAAQQDTPPSEIQRAFAALSLETGQQIDFTTVDDFRWSARDFPNSSLGCPQPGRAYGQVITPGYQFSIIYGGTIYDYRVSSGGGLVVLCGTSPVNSNGSAERGNRQVTPEPVRTEPCGTAYQIRSGDILADVAERCNTTVEEIIEANPDIENPSLIYPGQRLALPTNSSSYTVAIAPDTGPPGTEITLTASGLPVGASVQYGLGRSRSAYEVLGTREVGNRGVLTLPLSVPQEANLGTELVGVILLEGQVLTSEAFEVAQVALFDEVQIYLVALNDAGASGQPIGCNDSLVPITIDIPTTTAPLTAALGTTLTIEGRIYQDTGLYNPLHRSDLTVQSISIDNGLATIDLGGEINLGGACDAPRIESQLRQTALQYDTISEVTLTYGGLPLENVLR